jgi:hypothetical protein
MRASAHKRYAACKRDSDAMKESSSWWRSASSQVANPVAPKPLRRAGVSHARSPPPKTDRAEQSQRSGNPEHRRQICRSHRHQCQRRRRRTGTHRHMQRRPEQSSISAVSAPRSSIVANEHSRHAHRHTSVPLHYAQQPHREHRRTVTALRASTHSGFTASRAAAAPCASTHGGLASISIHAALRRAQSAESASAVSLSASETAVRS